MGFQNVYNPPGWIYDDSYDEFISPKGRIADKPGGRFKGQVSEKELVEIKNLADDLDKREAGFLEWYLYDEQETQDVTIAGYSVKLVRTITVGDVTVNVYRGIEQV